jgi:sigma-B regulation protein RsbU (phosphoserine phosphatase)
MIARYAGAGDLPMFSKSKNVEKIVSKGVLLGFSKAGEYEDYEIKLNSGDELFLVTDGITEARNKAGELYQEERLQNFLANIKTDEDSIEQIKKEIFAYTDGELEDDVSVIAMKAL